MIEREDDEIKIPVAAKADAKVLDISELKNKLKNV